jgi:hypothetical protein
VIFHIMDQTDLPRRRSRANKVIVLAISKINRWASCHVVGP